MADVPGCFSFRRGQEYYTSRGRKIADIIVGTLLGLVGWSVTVYVGSVFAAAGVPGPALPAVLLILLFYLIGIGAVVFGRKHIGIALLVMLTLFAVPYLWTELHKSSVVYTLASN